MKKNENILIGIVLVIVILFGGLGLFSSIDTGTRITVNSNLKFSYQEMNSGCVVKLEQTSGSTTWVGVYDNATFGAKNADIALSIGWINQSNYILLTTLLKDNPPSESCILSYMCDSGETKCNKWEYQTCVNGNWTLTSPSGCSSFYNSLNNCNGVYLYPSTKTANDYSDIGQCLTIKNSNIENQSQTNVNQTENTDVQTQDSEGLSKVLFHIGNFSVTLLIILIIIGVIILIFIFK